ncbi:MAG: hypothetical protein M3Q97_08735 [Bacteroidota bacterium]|nr:hypothetical protein [Bacteroidota bacterium]
MWIGGGYAGCPISWNAHPGDATDVNGRFYYSNGSGGSAPAAQIIYESWGGRMRFQFSTNHISMAPPNLVSWSDVLALSQGGNVGIGTLDCGNYKLAVEDKIGCRELKVTAANWCDYVFEDDYKLMPLAELEKFIKANHHLPEVPSAAEVEADSGVNVGEMQTLLLKKVEELTLYAIDLKKENQELKARLDTTSTDRVSKSGLETTLPYVLLTLFVFFLAKKKLSFTNLRK